MEWGKLSGGGGGGGLGRGKTSLAEDQRKQAQKILF